MSACRGRWSLSVEMLRRMQSEVGSGKGLSPSR